MELALYMSFVEFMSLQSVLEATNTCSAHWLNSLTIMYTSRRRVTWKAKKVLPVQALSDRALLSLGCKGTEFSFTVYFCQVAIDAGSLVLEGDKKPSSSLFHCNAGVPSWTCGTLPLQATVALGDEQTTLQPPAAIPYQIFL